MSAPRARWVLLALALTAPTVSAAGELALAIDGALEPFTISEQRATVRADVDCAVFAGVPPTIAVELTVEEAPAWIEAFVEEGTLTASPTTCPGGRTTLETELRLFWEPGAGVPLAGEVFALTLRAQAEDLQGRVFEASAQREIRAGLWGAAQLASVEPPPAAAPGDTVRFALTAVNGYNAPVQFEFTPDAAARALGIGVTRATLAPDTRSSVGFTALVPGTARPGTTLAMAIAWDATTTGASVGGGLVNVTVPIRAGDLPPPTDASADAQRAPTGPADAADPADPADTPAPGALGVALVGAVAALAVGRRR